MCNLLETLLLLLNKDLNFQNQLEMSSNLFILNHQIIHIKLKKAVVTNCKECIVDY
jgi:hypothetical protein